MSEDRRISVFVKPNSKKGPLVEASSTEAFTVYAPARAVDGKANAAVIELLAEYFDIPKSRLSIIRGHTSRHKVVEIR